MGGCPLKGLGPVSSEGPAGLSGLLTRDAAAGPSCQSLQSRPTLAVLAGPVLLLFL